MSEMSEQAAVAGYSPRLIPGEELVAPFEGGDGPCGEDLLFKNMYNELEELVREDDPEAMGGDAFKPKGGWKVADWGRCEQQATECLKQTSKDLRVAGYLARALGRKNGVTGMREGLWLMVELLERYWDALYPLPDKVRNAAGEKVLDPAPRAQELAIVFSEYLEVLEGQAACPEDIDDDKLEKVIARFDGMEEELRRLEAIMERRFDGPYDPPPDLSAGVRDAAASYRSVHSERSAARQAAEEEAERQRREAEEAERRAREEEEARQAALAAQQEMLASLGIGGAATGGENAAAAAPVAVQGREGAYRTIGAVAAGLVKEEPTDPRAVEILLGAAWAPGLEPSQPVPSEVRDAAERLRSEEEWDQLLQVARVAFSQGWGRDWVDATWAVATALESLGEAGEAALGALQAAVRERLSEEPGWPEKALPDGAAVGSTGALEWLRDLAPAEEEEGLESTGGIPLADLQAAADLAAKGQADAAVTALQALVEASPSPRDGFLRRLDLADFLRRCSMNEVAGPLYVDLAARARELRLQRWERPGLLARIHEGIYHCGLAGIQDCAELAETSLRQLCLLDPRRAMNARGQ